MGERVRERSHSSWHGLRKTLGGQKTNATHHEEFRLEMSLWLGSGLVNSYNK